MRHRFTGFAMAPAVALGAGATSQIYFAFAGRTRYQLRKAELSEELCWS
jgi:hypothetical protein